MMPQTATLDLPTALVPAPRTEQDPRPSDLVAFVASLGYSKITLALAYSDMPTKSPVDVFHTTEQIVAWVMQGIDRVGGVERLWWTDYQTRQISKRQARQIEQGGDLSKADKRELARLYSAGARRVDSCRGVAFRFVCNGDYPMARFPEVETTQTIQVDEHTTMTVTRRVCEEDRLNLESYTRHSNEGKRVYVGPDSRPGAV